VKALNASYLDESVVPPDGRLSFRASHLINGRLTVMSEGLSWKPDAGFAHAEPIDIPFSDLEGVRSERRRLDKYWAFDCSDRTHVFRIFRSAKFARLLQRAGVRESVE
jgi:hypothetical protein